MNRETGQMRYEQDRADRLWEAVRLWRNGTIEKILITGDGTSIVQPDGTSTEKLFLQYMEEMGIPQKVSAKHPAKRTLYSRNTEKRKH